jgi:hypothetical protein
MYTEKHRNETLHVCRIHKSIAHLRKYLSKFETKNEKYLSWFNQELRWVVFAKPVKMKKSHASVLSNKIPLVVGGCWWSRINEYRS